MTRSNVDGKPKNINETVETVVFVPPTSKSSLCKTIQKMDDRFTKLHMLPREKYVERGGYKIIEILTNVKHQKKEVNN